MVRESITGDYDPYSWWHRNMGPRLGMDTAELLKMVDIDHPVTPRGDVRLNVYCEYNNSEGRKVVGFIEAINVQRDCEIENVAESYPPTSHKEAVLTELGELTDLPVFVVWAVFDEVYRSDDHSVTCAIVRGFHVRQVGPSIEESMTEREYVSLLKTLHGLETHHTTKFEIPPVSATAGGSE